jgi:hypothetical protein
VTLRVELVADERALREFIALPLRLWPRELAVPILESSIRSWYSGRSAHAEAISLVVVRDASGRVVGRSTVHTDRRLDEKLGEKLLLFGATEFETDAAANVLFDHLETRAEATGSAALFGPVSLLPNQSGGVITSGFDQRGFVDSAWNPAWVPGVYEGAGFTRWGEADTWIVEPVGTAIEPSAAEWAAAGVRLEYGSKRRVSALIPELLELLNASFAQLAYYTQITPAEMASATDGLAFLLDERLLLLARDARTGRATAFVLVIPDITEFVQKVGGRLSFARQLQLLATRSSYRREAVLVIQGTDPERQGQGILSLLSRQLQVNLRVRGYRALRSTYIGRDNPASTAQFARFGGRPLQGYTFYRRPVDARNAEFAAPRNPDPVDPVDPRAVGPIGPRNAGSAEDPPASPTRPDAPEARP